MSHFTTVKTQLTQACYLKKALQDLGYEVEEGAVQIRGWGGRRTAVQIKIGSGTRGYDIGFRAGKSGYEMVADWWGIKGIKQRALLQQLSQRYAYQAAREVLQRQGFDLASEETQEDGRIHLVLRRMS